MKQLCIGSVIALALPTSASAASRNHLTRHHYGHAYRAGARAGMARLRTSRASSIITNRVHFFPDEDLFTICLANVLGRM